MTPGAPPTTTDAELLPGYYLDPKSGAWLTLPWPGDPTLPWAHQSRTDRLSPSLGPQAIWWAHQWLLDYWSGQPWRYVGAQARFLHLWYALRDDGRWFYRSGVKRGAKGTGKDPLAASLALLELLGPVRFTGVFAEGGERAEWDPRYVYRPGEPIGMPHSMALVQIGANSEGQAKDVLRVANAMISRAMRLEFGIDKGITRTQVESGSRIELLTNSERSSEGDPATSILLNESHHMTETSGGQALAGVARRNVGKSPGGIGRVCEFTNAHLAGEGSVAEDSFEAWQAQAAGRTKRADILYDSREAAPHLRLHVEEELELGIAQAYADSPWTDQERVRDEAQDPRTPVADSIRFYFNALPTNELAWVSPRKVDATVQVLITPDRDPITMFLDCSKSTDSTALVAARMSDGYRITLGCWQRPHGDRGTAWLAPRDEVDVEVRAAKARWAVQWFGVDPSPAKDDETEAQYWATQIDEWHREFRDSVLLWATPGVKGSSVLFDMRLSSRGGADRNRLFTEQAEITAREIDEDGTFLWDGNPIMRQHLHNARRRMTQWGVTLGKQSRDSKKLVDLAVAAVGAGLGRRLVLNSGKTLKKARSGVVVGLR